MTHLLCTLLLLADRSRWERLGDGFSGEAAKLSIGEVLGLVGVAAALALLISILHGFARRQDSGRTINSPQRLFGQLCRAHRLRWRDRRLLKRMAEFGRINPPVLLFVKPDQFPQDAGGEGLLDDAADVDALRRRLFANADKG